MLKSTLLAALCGVLLAPSGMAQNGEKKEEETVKEVYEYYSFDFSAHERPIAYSTLGNALELVNKVKVNPAVADRGGAYLFDGTISDKEFEIEVEFTIQSDINQARGFMILLTQ